VGPARARLIIADRLHTFAGSAGTVSPAAVLVRNGRIEAIGEPAALRANAGRIDVLDLSGTTLTPGLIDSHIHLTEWALAARDVDLSTAVSPEAAAAAVAAHTASAAAVEPATAAGEAASDWIRGRGWNPHLWGGAHPDRRFLDDRIDDRPIVLQSHDMHALWVNGEALRRAGIDEATPDPEGGRIVRDDSGRATGLLLDAAAQIVSTVIPAPSGAVTAAAVAGAQKTLHAWGITGVHALPAIHTVEPEPFGLLAGMHADGRLMLRVLQHIPLDRLDAAIAGGMVSGGGGGLVRVGAVKMFLDGALGSRTAWMLEPYEGSADVGIRVIDGPLFREIVERAARAGIASVVHAIGDAAVDLAFEVLGEPALRVNAMPHRIEHVQCIPAHRITDAGRLGVTCSMQPAHLRTDWRIADRLWGGSRAARTYAFRSLLEAGARLAFGSDAPVEPADPRLGLHAAVTRTDGGGHPEGGWFLAERLTIEQAFAGYTSGAADAAGWNGGVIRPGAFADVVAWRTDPLAAEPAAITDLDCVAAIVDGQLVYSA